MRMVVVFMTIGSGDRGDGVVVDDNLDDTCAKIGGGDLGDNSDDGDDKMTKNGNDTARHRWQDQSNVGEDANMINLHV